MDRPAANDAGKPGGGPAVRYSSAYLIYVIGLLALVNAINLMDRQIISVIAPALKTELHLNDTQLGFLSGLAFAVLYATLGIPIAAFADRSNRRNVVAVALVVWSGMTAVCGLAQNFLQLALARVGVGVGEAGCLPPSHSMISDYFPPERRGRVLAIMAAGGTVGTLFGLIAGGWLVSQFGWRQTLFILGSPGVLVGVIVFLTLREPGRGRRDLSKPDSGSGMTLLGLIRNKPTYTQLVLAMGTSTFVGYGLSQWLPSFYVRSYGLSMRDVGLAYGLVIGFASIIGTIAGGILGDQLIRRNVAHVLIFGVVCSVLSFLFKIGLVTSRSVEASLAFNFATNLFNVAFYGPVFALVQGVAPSHLRARAVAVLTLCVSLIGNGLGPLFVGLVSDAYAAAGAGKESLRYALLWCSALALWPIIHLILARKSIERDLRT